MIAGIATAVKELNPAIEVIGVNAVSAPAMYNAFHSADRPQVWDTLADALSGEIENGSITVPICQRNLDDMLLVTEGQIAAAMRFMLETQGWVVEGGGAVGVAAMMHDIAPRDGTPTAVVVSGGNVDLPVLRRVLDE